MTDLRQAAQQALEAMEGLFGGGNDAARELCGALIEEMNK